MVGTDTCAVSLCFNQSCHMHQRASSSTAFRQRRLDCSLFRVSAATPSSLCGSWKRRRTTLSPTFLGRPSITCRTPTRCQSPFRRYSRTLRIVFGLSPSTLPVKVHQVNRQIGSTPCKPNRRHLRLKYLSDPSTRRHCASDGRYVNFYLH